MMKRDECYNKLPEFYSFPPDQKDTQEETTIDVESILKSSPRKLVLHFDINETLLIGDVAGGDTVEDCLNKIIAKTVFVKYPNENSPKDKTISSTKEFIPSQWWNGQNLDDDDSSTEPPPIYTGWDWPSNSCPYYRTAYKKQSKNFTSHHGKLYQPLYMALKEAFLTPTKNDNLPLSHPFYRMLSSFFHTLVMLQKLGKDYTLVLRTFGTDLDDIANAISDFAKGKHPLYPTFREPKLILEKCHMYKGRYRLEESSNHDQDGGYNSIFDLFQWDDSSKVVASGDDELLHVIENLSICGIQDDYHYWDNNDNSPSAGKPVWIHPMEQGKQLYHHLFFDDNIHNDESDSIVAVRTRKDHGSHWRSLSGQETINQQGKYVVRVPTVAAILDKNWFLNQIALAEHKFL